MTGRRLATIEALDVEPGHTVSLSAVDAVELIEVLEMFCGWFDHDHTRLADGLGRAPLTRQAPR